MDDEKSEWDKGNVPNRSKPFRVAFENEQLDVKIQSEDKEEITFAANTTHRERMRFFIAGATVL